MVATPVEKTGKNAGSSDEKKKESESTLKVGAAAYELISKLAKLRDLSIANLFREQDVEDFFSHLYMEELKRESDRMKRKKS